MYSNATIFPQRNSVSYAALLAYELTAMFEVQQEQTNKGAVVRLKASEFVPLYGYMLPVRSSSTQVLDLLKVTTWPENAAHKQRGELKSSLKARSILPVRLVERGHALIIM
jgi:hypothetical protein